jgi:hypothetical protein
MPDNIYARHAATRTHVPTTARRCTPFLDRIYGDPQADQHQYP